MGTVAGACTLFVTLIDTEVRTRSAVESALFKAGNTLTLGRLLVLCTVRDTPACRIQKVTTSQDITLRAASRLAGRLHRDGLLHHTPYEHDRRATILAAIEQGLAHLEGAYTVVEEEQERLFAPLSTIQRKELTYCLTLITETTKEYA